MRAARRSSAPSSFVPDSFPALDARQDDPLIGELVSHYRVVKRLGRGGMGEVFLAEDVTLRRSVALKVQAADETGDRLLHEARAASALVHPNIAVVYEIGDWERGGRRQTFIAMEYVSGRTLAELARDRELGALEVFEIGCQVVTALAAAHAHGVVHRDVKPSNVMVMADGRVKVLDFGLAKHVPFVGESAETWSGQGRVPEATGALVGTAAYMSPEQVKGLEVDARSDVFSLGVVLYELLGHQRPFVGETAMEVLGAVLHLEPPPLRVAAFPGLEPVVHRMLSKDREQRFASMAEVGLALAEARRGSALREDGPPPSAPTSAAIRFTNITGRPEDEWLGTGIAETLMADLKLRDGLRLVSRERTNEVLRKLAARGVDEDALPLTLGREVGARFVVSGGYQRQGEEIRVTARVTDIATGAVAGTSKVDGSLSEIFSVQDRIALGVASLLRISVAPSRRDGNETEILEAYAAFSRGLVFLRAESHESIDHALECFERATALDPEYARAHMQRGVALALQAGNRGQAELYEPALESLKKATVLRPSLAEAWRELGATLVYTREDEGISAIERALALEPGDASAHAALARAYFIGKGDFARAAVEYERALLLNPQAGWSALQLAHCAAFLGQYPRGEAVARRAIVLQEEFLAGQEGLLIIGAYLRLGHLYALQGRHADAKLQFEREIGFIARVDHSLKARIFIELHTRLGAALLGLGEEAGGHATLDLATSAFERRLRLEGDDPFTRYYAAGAHALRGDAKAALESLEKAVAGRRAFTQARARLDPLFDTLRQDERFRSLVGV
jgi:TolB-like protein/tetratricopeptide (TPR) repeat protein/predicted Ser/Thr protein kinase